MNMTTSMMIALVKPGDELEIEPIDKFPYFDRHIKVNDIMGNGFLYGLSSTCDGYLYPFYAIKSFKIL